MKQSARVHTALIELILVILFFSISAAVILQFFVAAHLKSEESAQKSAAILQAQQIAEGFQQTGTLPQNALAQQEDAVLYFDEDWRALSSLEGASFLARLSLQEEKTPAGSLRRLTVDLHAIESDGQDELYALSVEKYVPRA